MEFTNFNSIDSLTILYTILFALFVCALVNVLHIHNKPAGDGNHYKAHVENGKLTRRLGHFEKGMFYLSAMGDGGGIVVNVLLINSQVPLEPGLVKKALYKLNKRYPLLRMRTHTDTDDTLWFREMEDTSTVLIKNLKDTSANDWQKVFEKESQLSFDLLNGPLWRVCVLQEVYDAEKKRYDNSLLFTFHHMICDGSSTMALYSQFLEYLNDLQEGKDVEVESMILREPCTFLVSHKMQLSFTERLMFYLSPTFMKMKSMFSKPAKNIFMTIFPPVILKDPSVEKKTCIIPRVIQADELSKMIKIGKENKCTVHSVITAATRLAITQIMQAGAENTLPDPLPFITSFNIAIRKECQPEVQMNEFGSFFSLVNMNVPTPCSNVQQVFWKFAQECHNMVHTKIAKKEYCQFLKRFANADFKTMLSSMSNQDKSNGGRFNNIFNISNRGRFSIGEDKDRPHQFASTYYGMAQQHAGPPLANCIVSANGSLYWGMAYYSNITTEKQAEEFIDLALAILREACSLSPDINITKK